MLMLSGPSELLLGLFSIAVIVCAVVMVMLWVMSSLVCLVIVL